MVPRVVNVRERARAERSLNLRVRVLDLRSGSRLLQIEI